jgi:aryl-alcohol dehydrogenase-like predicted oxidoreductase
VIARRRLGASGLDAPILGLGVSGPHGLGLADTAGLVRQALAAGAGLFDSAPFYGDAEARLGAALRGTPRADYLLITKAGTQRRGGRVAKDFSPAALEASLVSSLRALGSDHVDLFLLHGPGPEHLTDALAGFLQGLPARGLARACGVCGRGPSLVAALKFPGVHVVQAPVWEQYGARSWATLSAAAGLGFIGIEAMRRAAPGWRTPKSPADLWYLARAIKSRAPRPDGGSPLARLEAALDAPGVGAVLVATTRPGHLAENLAAAAQRSV